MNIRKLTLTPEVIARHLERNEQTWNALVRLGVGVGTQLELAFAYGTAGSEADRELARFLQRETEYTIAIEPQGVAGATPPMAASPAALGEWVKRMVLAGHEHGGCVFDGWTTRVATRSRRAAIVEHVPAFDAANRPVARTPSLNAR